MSLKGPTKDHVEIKSWADGMYIVPLEMEPHRVNSEPACMALLLGATAQTTDRVRVISWDDFFAKFDLLDLTLVYDAKTVYNEILQVDREHTTIPPPYRSAAAD